MVIDIGEDGEGEGFVDLAHEEMAKIQAYAFRTRREHRAALEVARGQGAEGEEIGRYERAAAALLAKAKQEELKEALDSCVRAKDLVNDCVRRLGDMNEDDKGRVEMECLRELRALAEGGSSAGAGEARSSYPRGEAPSELGREATVLDAVVSDLSRTQRTLSFQSDLLQSQDQASSSPLSAYTAENFAYGTTPLDSFLEVFNHPALAARAGECRSCNMDVVVFGSSSGWLCFYAALGLGLRSVGHELLRPLVEVARSTAERHELGDDAVSFVLGDMLAADLGNCGILVLASQCWDRGLAREARVKAARELPRGSAVIDYLPWDEDVLGGNGGDPAVEEVGVVTRPVSWNQAQEFHILIKR